MLACLRRAGSSALRRRPLARFAPPSAFVRNARLYSDKPDLATLKERFARELGIAQEPEPDDDGPAPLKKTPGMTRKQLEKFWRAKVERLPDRGDDENYTLEDLKLLDLLPEDVETLRFLPEDMDPEQRDGFVRQAIDNALMRDVEELFGSTEPIERLREEVEELEPAQQEELYAWINAQLQEKLGGMDEATIAQLEKAATQASERDEYWGKVSDKAQSDPDVQAALAEFWNAAREATGVKDEETFEGRFEPTSEQAMRMMADSKVDEAMTNVMNIFKARGLDMPTNLMMSEAMRELDKEMAAEDEEFEEAEDDPHERPGDAPAPSDNPSQVPSGGKVPSPGP
ncbi:hypothetical protein BD626DRAFT_114087 [Schizophyllum amplum]|uniref:Uncharacterized protein n=1 Tax=Schizophyllum amplum TaxID=97359 RepID=A0A550CU30_9AGAR|nr:hypothetical protein BD626DRAFT_114087 [Auriculariopsis ampla]